MPVGDDSVPNGDDIPWCDHDFVISCERAFAEAKEGSSDEFLQECILRLLSALVHSRRLKDVKRGIAILEASLARTNSSLPKGDKLYLLAVGCYRSGDYSRSRELVDECLGIAPDWRSAQILKKKVEDRIKKDLQGDDTVIGIVVAGIAAAGVALVGGIVAALARRN
ncbi:hypothetical protein I3843_14G114800 [Carya illinoinensis]|uniref:Mitochondrial fission 1 protein n=1 Tax=Carya illinoinensis TaxID=32201 RepID=A0A8T1NJA1_CARIL|nr:mitochondrial fission 1 protein A-like isoform X3 [Carya illinoinensis]KAG2671073.1 hypothetical protein I3760_14G116100 [Carya illinoinensis]KAG6629862.1 hypothetical protein CIPAW_14G114700 [Carya illinoinensis]KAG7947843.1 hypothetical protein I3843_14G114800 [Carya illinoinensis]